MKNQPQFNDTTLKHLKKIELMILKDFIKICEENNIEYYSYGGTSLGAIRHGGFIPWDDDVDVILFREEYEKFIEITKTKYNEKYDFLCMENYEDYTSTCCKMSLKETKRDDMWINNATFDLGIHIDIFALDYAPKNKIKWFIYYQKCQILKKMDFLLTGTRAATYSTKTRKLIGTILNPIFNRFNMLNYYKKCYKRFVKNTNSNDDLLFDISAICYNKPFPKEIFRPPKKVKFESIEVNVPNDVDQFLKIIYGDYMKVPPVEKRPHHFCENVDFGKY